MANSCIITGATGYIGSHVLKFLLSEGWDIHIIADPRFGYDNIKDVLSQIDTFEYRGDVNSLCDYFKSVDADVVFHLAAAVITNYKPEQVPVLIQSNIQFGTEVLEAMKASTTRCFVGTGSYWQNYNSDGYNPVDLYAATKEAFEQILQYYVDAHHFKVVTLKLFDVYGEDDVRPKIWNILRDIAGTEKSLDVSPGEQMLDLVHVSDVSTAYQCAFEYLKIVDNPCREVIGVFTGQRIALKDAIRAFEHFSGKAINVNFGGKKYKEREIMSPISNLKRIPGWTPKISPMNGLKKMAGIDAG
jgi:CDP-3, 6-dideoxy-D-glycero-L-glycero-4-hexulose-4-reductase